MRLFRSFLALLALVSVIPVWGEDHYVDPSDPSTDTSIATELYTIQNLLTYLTFTQFPMLVDAINAGHTNSNNVVVNVPPVDLQPIITRLDSANSYLASLELQIQTLDSINANIVNGNATITDIYTLLNRANLQGLSDNVSALVQTFTAFYYQHSAIFAGMGVGGESLLSVLTKLDNSVKTLHADLTLFMDSMIYRLDNIITILGGHGSTFSDIKSLLQTIADRPPVDLSTLEYYTGSILFYLTAVQQKYYSDFQAFSYLPPALSGLHWESPTGLSEASTDSAFDLSPHTGNYFNDVLISIENVRKLQAQQIKGGVLNVVYSRAISNEVAIQTIEVTNRLEDIQVSLDQILGTLTNDVATAESALSDAESAVESGVSSAESEVFEDSNKLEADDGKSIISKGRGVLSAYSVDSLPDYVYWVSVGLDSVGEMQVSEVSADIRPYKRLFGLMRAVSTFGIWAGIVMLIICFWRLVGRLWGFLINCAYGTNND